MDRMENNEGVIGRQSGLAGLSLLDLTIGYFHGLQRLS